MPCFHPLDAWQGRNGGPVFFSPSVEAHRYLQVPCGQCSGCRLERARQWAMRCMHEAQCWDFNCFLTATYSDDKLPEYGSLVIADHQKFMKRLRKRLGHPPMKFYMCGEYGDRNGRPHYHYILFGVDFMDKVYYKTTKSGYKLYNSALLDDIWKLGHINIGSVTFDSACYVASYIMKKTTGRGARDAYNDYDPVTGEVFSSITPEFNQMSLSSAVGAEFLSRYRRDFYPRDKVPVNGVLSRPPRYYDKVVAKDDPLLMDWIKHKRRLKAQDSERNAPERLEAREYILNDRLKRYSRDRGEV